MASVTPKFASAGPMPRTSIRLPPPATTAPTMSGAPDPRVVARTERFTRLPGRGASTATRAIRLTTGPFASATITS
jgi:hypothetical protein